MKEGDKVRVSIKNRERWALGAAECLNGKEGTIERIKAKDWFADSEVLVQFDTPAKTWWTNQSPPSAFWFLKEDIETA